MRTFALVLAVVAVAVVTISASARADSQGIGVLWHVGNGGPPCNVGGNPDAKTCVSSNQDGVAPLEAPWIVVTRANPAVNWSFVYGVWVLNSSVLIDWTNARSATIDLSLNPTLHNIVNVSERGAVKVYVTMAADTPYVAINVEHISPPSSVTLRGANITWRYDASLAGGTLTFTPTFTPTFTSGVLAIGFPGSGGGGTPTMVPYLPGLTNFPQLDVIPNIGQIAAFSCNNVTLADPRSAQEISATRLWVFDWGDGTPQTRTQDPTATHIYGSPGAYNVTMTVQGRAGAVAEYSGRVDTTPLACAFHVARSVGFVILTGAFAALMVLSFVLPKRTKKERKKMRRAAVGCFVAVVVLVVIL